MDGSQTGREGDEGIFLQPGHIVPDFVMECDVPCGCLDARPVCRLFRFEHR